MKRILIVSLFLAGCASSSKPRSDSPPPRNVIVLIGDGMGVSQITLTRLLHGRLALEDFPVTGLVRTDSADAWVTDSAAAATAIATGRKTNNFAVGMDAEGKPLRTILESARGRGLATGLVTTSRITHATPASFAAHVDSRQKEGEIAKQYLASDWSCRFCQ